MDFCLISTLQVKVDGWAEPYIVGPTDSSEGTTSPVKGHVHRAFSEQFRISTTQFRYNATNISDNSKRVARLSQLSKTCRTIWLVDMWLVDVSLEWGSICKLINTMTGPSNALQSKSLIFVLIVCFKMMKKTFSFI